MAASGLFTEPVIEFLNSEFGSDISKLKNAHVILEGILASEKELEGKLQPVTQEVSKISLTKYAENALHEIVLQKQKTEELKNTIKSQLEESKPLRDHFSEHLSSVKQLENLNCYLQWVLKIENTNCLMEESLKQDVTHHIITNFMGFKEMWSHLQSSNCKHLFHYVEKNLQYWHDILREKFGSNFQKVLASLHWPVLSSAMSAPLNLSAENVSKFSALFNVLCELQLPTNFPNTNVDKGLSENSQTKLLPLLLMFQPLQKRFVFHFMGKKQTNRLDKPEWYLTQILTWISDHSVFMDETVQPLINKLGLDSVKARAEMMRELVHLAIVRLQTDLPSLLNDDILLSHAIDEVLLFERELRNQGYPKFFPSILEALCKEPCFSRWRSLEHKNALEKMDKLLSAETAWNPRYQDERDLDELNVPECAETFMTLLLTMTERYSSLPQISCQLSFLALQLELLDDFRLRLHQLCQFQVQEPLKSNYCSIINAVHYVVTVLNEWSNLPFFLQLHCSVQHESQKSQSVKESRHPSRSFLKNADSISSEQTGSSSDEDLEKDTSIFEEAIGFLEHMQKDLLQTLGERIMLDIKAKSRPYRKEKWFCMPAVQEKKSLEVSCLAYSLLDIINCSLHNLQELLAKPLFTAVWQYIARELNLYLYEEVILQNSFSEGGAAQLNFDMTRNLFPIFGNFTQKPENYFKLVKESCILLSLNSAPAMLLRETIKQSEDYTQSQNSLEELGVQNLSPSQALLILSLRNDLTI